MSSKPICAYIYINGEIIHSSSANAIFRSEKTKSIPSNPTMMLPNIITTILSSIRDNHIMPIITTLWYHCHIYQFNGRVEYRAIQIIDEEGGWHMFDTFTNTASVICMELKVDVHNSL